MASRKLQIPGGSTSKSDIAVISIRGTTSEPTELMIKYIADIADDGKMVYGEILFKNVLEYRWTSEMISYEEFIEHQDDGGLGLYEITDSKYVSRISQYTHSPSVFSNDRWMISGAIPVENIRHFRIGFDDYGDFNILAMEVHIRQMTD